MPSNKNIHIALLLNRESVYGRRVMQGVMSYVRPSLTWKVSIGRLSFKDVHKIVSLKPDGIIAEVFSPRAAEILDDSGIPYVDVSDVVKQCSGTLVCADNSKIGQIAAEHFLERGFTNFAYFGGKKNHFAKLRESGFAKTLHDRGLNYSVFTKRLNLDFYGSNVIGESSEPFHQWLETLPKPVAIFACNDAFALIANETCRQLGHHVPDEVAILGVDNDEQFCQLETPAISSVELPLRQIGHEAVSVLEDLMNGTTLQSQSKLFAPTGVVLRQSSDIVAFEDETLSEAIKYIREHADTPMTVEGVCDELCISRRLLEKSIKKQIGHSPLAEIHRAHVERAKDFLINSRMTLPKIAYASGFRSPERMSVIFKRLTGTTPSKYRRTLSK